MTKILRANLNPVSLKAAANGCVVRVFDTNGFGDLLPVDFTPIEGGFQLTRAPCGQVYVEVNNTDDSPYTAMTPTMKIKHDMIVALQAQVKAEVAASRDHGSCHIEAAKSFGFRSFGGLGVHVQPFYQCTERQLIDFATAAEGAGRFTFARRAGIALPEALAILDCTKYQPATKD